MDNTNQQAARAAKRFLTERVRNDWSWPDTPEPYIASDEEVLEVTEFRERYYGDSCSEDSAAPSSSSVPKKTASSPQPPADEYKFDSPDSVGDEVAQKRQERKRKRRAAQEEEMQWNAGLRMFVERRDAWTGAASVRKYGTGTNRSATSTSPNSNSNSNGTTLAHSSSKNDPTDPLIPVAPPLLANNAIRASIRPSTYPDIYTNVVITGRSPTVPVNLADMTRALVLGWKNDGEWPPKPGPLDPLAGKRRVVTAAMKSAGEGPFLSHHPHVKKGVDSVKRILHLNGHQNENGHDKTM